MKKIITIRFFAFFMMLFMCAFPVYSAENEQSMLSKILITPEQNNSYALNLYFNDVYKDKAFIQPIDMGKDLIYLPNSSLKNKKAKIIYSNNADKKNIKLFVDQKPIMNKGKESNYIRISVNMNADYTIKAISKTIAEDKSILFMTTVRNAYPLIIITMIGLICLMLRKILKITKSSANSNSYTSFPSTFQTRNYRNIKEMKLTKNALKQYKTKNAATNPFITADRESFKCFDIPYSEDELKANNKFQDVIKNTAHTNPINETENDKLDIPFADEVIKNAKQLKQHDKNGDEIISIININPNKGFYLASTKDFMSLYAFTKDNLVLLKRFNDLAQLNLQARFYDNSADGEVYIVRLDNYKSMVEFSNNSIRELVVL